MGKKKLHAPAEDGDSAPLFTRFVQAGRLCTIEYGPDFGKLCFIADIITLNRVLVDGAGITGVVRQDIPIRRLRLTDVRIPVCRGIQTTALKRAVTEQGALETFNTSTAGKKRLLKQLKSKMTDFDRFKLRTISRKRNRLANKHMATLMKTKK
eukprot:GHVS01046658.1.p2 GENE.GHVS01046658.1~~GHVS01046658.1.p2  ORF type:complete len:153 (+),score=24.79 GHVS01046658.1:88-546(+)